MRRKNLWKQAMALTLSAALIFGNSAPVFAADGDAAMKEGTSAQADGDEVENPDAYKKLTFDFEDGQMAETEDGITYTENGIVFNNQCYQPLVDEEGNPNTTNNPSNSKGAEVVDASTIPEATDEDKAHGKVLKFDKGMNEPGESGIDYMTTVDNALAAYDYSNGVTFSFDIRPEVQGDWDYLFAFGQFQKFNVTGTIGFIAGYEEPWTPFFPNDGWVEGNNVDSNYAYFADEANAHKWYTFTYIYTNEGMTISINGVPAVTYRDSAGKMETILQEMSKGKLRLGKGVVEKLEGFVGYMDNVSIQPVHPGAHVYGEPTVKTEPTCDEVGTQSVTCTMCGVISLQDIPALGHEYGTLIPAKEATCTEQGNLAHYKCSRCASYFIDGADGKEQVGPSTIRVNAKGHNYTETITKATAEKDGEVKKVCNACPESTTGHSVTEVIDKVSSITLEKTSYLYTGKPITPAAIIKDSKGKELEAANYTVTYLNNTKAGTATVKIDFKGDKYEGSVTRTFKITETASLTLNKSKVTLYTGKASKTAKVTATVKGASKAVTWKSSKPTVAKVDKKGNITAVKAGTATITATANGISKSVKVTVKNPTITVKNGKKAVKKNTVSLGRNKSVTLTVSVSPKKSGSAIGKLSKKDKKVATVSYKNGKLKIKAKKKGTVKVKVTSGKASKTITIKVK